MSLHSKLLIVNYIQKMEVLLNKKNGVEWRVIESVCMDEGEYLLILENDKQKIMARVLSTHTLNPMDILFPTSGNIYIINNITGQLLRFITATELNPDEWRALTL